MDKKFDLDGACDDKGINAHVAAFYSPSNRFLDADFARKNVFLNAPFDRLEEFLRHYLRTKLRDPSTKGVFVVPKWTRKPWFRLLRNLTLVEEIPAGLLVFSHPNRKGARTRITEGPTK